MPSGVSTDGRPETGPANPVNLLRHDVDLPTPCSALVGGSTDVCADTALARHVQGVHDGGTPNLHDYTMIDSPCSGNDDGGGGETAPTFGLL